MTARNWTATPADFATLDGLDADATLLRSAERRIRENVEQARTAGVPWRAIAGALGVTVQAAQQRYGVRAAAPGH